MVNQMRDEINAELEQAAKEIEQEEEKTGTNGEATTSE